MSRGLTHHPIDVYGTQLHVAVTPKGWRRLRKQVTSLAKDPGGLGFASFDLHETANRSEPHISIWIDVPAHEGDEVMLINTCAHEAAHASSMLFDHIGQEYDGSSEAHAYLVGAIASTLFRCARAAS